MINLIIPEKRKYIMTLLQSIIEEFPKSFTIFIESLVPLTFSLFYVDGFGRMSHNKVQI